MCMERSRDGSTLAATGSLLEWDGAPSEVQNSGPAFHARTYLVREAFRRLRPANILDIGCGRGHVTALVAPYARSVFAVDLARAAVEETAERLTAHPDAHVGIADVRTGEWGDLTPPQHGFETVLLSEVLEHLDDDAAMLRRVKEILAPTGHVVITVPAHPSLWTEWDDMAGHVRRYTKQQLADTVTSAGFDIRSFQSWGFPLSGWLAIRGARMRGRRVAKNAGAEVPSAIAKIMPIATLAFRPLARAESIFADLDRGAGYVVVAQAVGHEAG